MFRNHNFTRPAAVLFSLVLASLALQGCSWPKAQEQEFREVAAPDHRGDGGHHSD